MDLITFFKNNKKRIVKYYLIILLVVCVRFLIGGRESGFQSLTNLFRLFPYLTLIAIPLVVYAFYAKKKEKEYKESHPRDESKVWDITKEIIGKDKYKEDLENDSKE